MTTKREQQYQTKMKRKSRSKKSFRGKDDTEEQKSLLNNESDTGAGTSGYDSESPNASSKIKEKAKQKKQLRRLDSKISMFAPEACDTLFEDVPVMTVCPNCRAKVVTKTSHSKKKLCCLWCCSDEFLSFFKPIRHKCPKCNYKIAQYTRFALAYNFKGHQNIYDKPAEKTENKREDIIEETIEHDSDVSNNSYNQTMSDGNEYKKSTKQQRSSSRAASTEDKVNSPKQSNGKLEKLQKGNRKMATKK